MILRYDSFCILDKERNELDYIIKNGSHYSWATHSYSNLRVYVKEDETFDLDDILLMRYEVVVPKSKLIMRIYDTNKT